MGCTAAACCVEMEDAPTPEKIKPTDQDPEPDIKSEDSMNLSEDEIKDIVGELQSFLSFLQTKTNNKVTIGQGGQGKVRKYYRTKYQKEVVEKIVNLNNCTRGTLGVSGVQNFIKEAVLLSKFDHLI